MKEEILKIIDGFIKQKESFREKSMSFYAPAQLEVLKELREKVCQLEPPVSQENGGQWQTCPKCNGQGCVSRPPWIPGDIVEWAGTTATYPCNVCNGKMIIKY